MSGRLLLRPSVPDDLQSIINYLDQYSLTAADRFRAAFFEAAKDLAGMPGMGSPKYFKTRQLNCIRSWSIPGFRKFLILSRPLPDGIEVLAVSHGARELRSLLLGR